MNTIQNYPTSHSYGCFSTQLAIDLGGPDLAILCGFFIEQVNLTGNSWVSISHEDLFERFPFFRRGKIQRLLKDLKEKKVIKSKRARRAPNSYAFVNESKFVKGA